MLNAMNGAEFQRVVPVINPVCTNIERAKGYLKEIRDIYPGRFDAEAEIVTDPNRTKTVERIRETVKPGDLVPVIGGDGTIGAVAEALAGKDGNENIPMLILWGGNGNDAARDLNGEPPKPGKIRELLRAGQPVVIHPLQIVLDSVEKLQAVNYFEIGSNAKGAALINSRTWRSLPGYDNNSVRSAYEWLALPPAAFFSRRFPLTEAGITREIVNFTAVNCRYLAKHARPPVSLAEKRAFITECATQPGLLPWALRSVWGLSKGEYLEKNQPREMKIGRTVLCHADAEPHAIERGTVVTLSLAEQPFYALSTRHAEAVPVKSNTLVRRTFTIANQNA